MTKLKIWLVFISLFVWRWWSYPSPLPSEWVRDTKVRYTVTVLNKPEYSDTQTIVKNGIWYIPVRGYKEIIPGSRVTFEGMVEPKMVMGKVVQVKMIDAKIAEITRTRSAKVWLGNLRERWVEKLQKNLPEPMASLAAGILLGVKGQMSNDFYQALVKTGTLHIVAASGYNVSVVAEVIMRSVGTFMAREVAVGIAMVGIGMYVVLSGGSASVVRAGIMASLTMTAYYFGRPSEAKWLLMATVMLMLLYNPLYILDIGFQLSVMATAGLLYLEPRIREWINPKIGGAGKIVQVYLAEYLYPTLAATIYTLPVILWHFGRVSWISPLTNILVLPSVPLVMLLAAGIVVLGPVAAWTAYPVLAYVVWVIRLWE